MSLQHLTRYTLMTSYRLCEAGDKSWEPQKQEERWPWQRAAFSWHMDPIHRLFRVVGSCWFFPPFWEKKWQKDQARAWTGPRPTWAPWGGGLKYKVVSIWLSVTISLNKRLYSNPRRGWQAKTKASRLFSSWVDTSLYALPGELQCSRSHLYFLPWNNSFLWSVS